MSKSIPELATEYAKARETHEIKRGDVRRAELDLRRATEAEEAARDVASAAYAALQAAVAADAEMHR